MHPDIGSLEQPLAALIQQATGTDDAAEARASYRKAFAQLRPHLDLHPRSGARPSGVFESAAVSARLLAACSLPLATAVIMHLYPYCALQCVPLSPIDPAWFKRALLLREIRGRSLILANVGGERTRSSDESLIATPRADGIELDGTCEYMSLASVADLVLCKAMLPDGSMALCAADLSGDSVKIGSCKFRGTMRLSDTWSVSFAKHRVPRGRYVTLDRQAGLQCIADYQRCWFHLFLSEIHVARLRVLARRWSLDQGEARLIALAELTQLRSYALRLLDDFAPGSDPGALMMSTALLKLRTSLLAQETAVLLRGRKIQHGEETEELESAAQELGYIHVQPTADAKILGDLESRSRSEAASAQHAPRAWFNSGAKLLVDCPARSQGT